jgi:Starch-binding associating with outer membrane
MKRISYKILTVAAALVFLAGSNSCNKLETFPEGINVDPNTTPDPITAALLTNIEANLGGASSEIRGGLYAQYFSETQYTEASLYQLPEFNYGVYSSVLFDCENIIRQNTLNPAKALASGSNKDQISIARILKALIYANTTDHWGDIPYSEALKGGANIYPKYDTQEDIYKDLLKELKEAVAGFDNGAPIKGDIIYGGNIAKWKKLANSLRLITALRMSKVFPAAGGFAATEFAAALADGAGIISTNADNFTLTYPGGVYNSPWFNTYDGRNDYAISKTMTDILTGMSDARRSQFATGTTGFPYGLTRDEAITIGSWEKVLKASYRDDINDYVVIIGAPCVLLAKAEGLERGWVAAQGTAEAEIAYKAAIDQSYAEWGGLAGAATYYGAGGAANYTTGVGSAVAGQNSFGSIVAGQNATTTNKLERIALQRYIAAFPNGYEAWTEWRRTGFPKLFGTTRAINASKQIPRRWTYGQSETALNPTNLAIAIARLSGGNTQDARIWWDKP